MSSRPLMARSFTMSPLGRAHVFAELQRQYLPSEIETAPLRYAYPSYSVYGTPPSSGSVADLYCNAFGAGQGDRYRSLERQHIERYVAQRKLPISAQEIWQAHLDHLKTHPGAHGGP